MSVPTGSQVRARFERRIEQADESLKEAQRGVLAQFTAKGALFSGARLKKQAQVRNEHAHALIELCLEEVTHLPGQQRDINWAIYGPFLLERLDAFLERSRDGLAPEKLGGAAAARDIAEILDKADARLRAELADFGAGLWRPRRPTGGVNVSNTTNNVTAINSPIGTLQQGGAGAKQNATTELNVALLKEALDAFEGTLATADIDQILREAINVEIATIRPQLSKAQPNGTIVGEGVKSLRNLAEGVAAGLLTEMLLPVLAAAAPFLGLSGGG